MAGRIGKLLGFCLGIALVRGNPVLGGGLGLLIGHALDERWARRRDDNPYAVLGLDASASDAELDRAYRRLMAQHHPDRVAGADDAHRAASEARARDINAAYDRIRSRRRTG